MLDLLAQTYFQNALVAGTLVGVTCSFVGVYVLLTRIVFLGITLAQIASAGVALALLLGWNPLVTALAASIGSSIAFSQIRWRGRAPIEGVLGASYVVAAALGTVFIAKNPVGEARALTVLFGNILSVPAHELAALVIASLAVLLVHLVFHKEFIFVSFDFETAAAQGVKARLWSLVLYLSLGVAIAFAIRSAGVLLTFTLLVVPAFGARLLTRGLGPLFAAAVGLGTLSIPIGLGAAFALDLPTGATTSLTLAALVAVALAGRTLVRMVRRPATVAGVLAALLVSGPGTASAQSPVGVEAELRALREAVAELRKIVTEQQRVINELTGGRRATASPTPPPIAPVGPPPAAVAPSAPAPLVGVEAPSGPPPARRGAPDEPPPARERGLPPWVALLPEIRLGGNFIGNYTTGNRRKLERALGEEREGEEFFVRRNRLNLQEIELGLRSAIDPFARFEASLATKQTFRGDLEVHLEEAFLVSGALPGRIELKVGRFRTGFGEFNDSAPEEIPEVDPPNVIRNLFGREGEGWIDTGVALTHRVRLTDDLSLMLWGAAFNGDNEASFHGGRAGVARRPAWFGRVESFLELGPTTGVEGSVGFAQGHALDEQGRATLRSRILSAHLEFQHRDPVLVLYRGFNLLGEFFYTWRDRFREPTEEEQEAGAPRRRQVLGRFGLYALAEAQIARNWSIGARFDYSQLPTREEEGPSVRSETAGSLILSYRPSRYLTLRGQYTHTERNFAPSSDEFFLQALFKSGFERPGPF